MGWTDYPEATAPDGTEAALVEVAGTTKYVLLARILEAIQTGAKNFADMVLSRVVLKDYGETLKVHGNAGASATVNLEEGNVHSITIDQNTTLTFSNPPASGTAGSFMLVMTNPGSFTITWPASAKWPGGTEPTWTTSGRDRAVFFTEDGGTVWDGVQGGADFS